jgi:lipopolysaccharide biosynthesis glycosyltransferase
MVQIPIVLAINDAYLNQAKVLIYSLCANAKPTTHYTIHILHYQLQEATQQALLQFHASHGWQGEILFLGMSEHQWASIPFVGKWGKETNYRLFLPELLPNLDKILYIDADVIVLGDLTAYYQLELGEHAFASVKEDVLPFRKATIFSQLALLDQNTIDYQDDFDYINAGVLLLNLAKLRQIELTEKSLRLMALLPKEGVWLTEFVPAHVDPLVMPDQDILYYLAHAYTAGIVWVPVAYNYLPFMFDHQKLSSLTQKNYHDFVAFLNRRAVEVEPNTPQAVIVHFAACHPWKILHSKGLYADIYHEYAKHIGWNTTKYQNWYLLAKIRNYIRYRLPLPNLKEQLQRVLKRV